MAFLVSGWVWFGVFVEIKSRGVVRVCLLVCGGLVGLSGLIDTAWGMRRGRIALSISFVRVRVSSRGASTGGFLLLDRRFGLLGRVVWRDGVVLMLCPIEFRDDVVRVACDRKSGVMIEYGTAVRVGGRLWPRG